MNILYKIVLAVGEETEQALKSTIRIQARFANREYSWRLKKCAWCLGIIWPWQRRLHLPKNSGGIHPCHRNRCYGQQLQHEERVRGRIKVIILGQAEPHACRPKWDPIAYGYICSICRKFTQKPL